jgi:hypothetical protein
MNPRVNPTSPSPLMSLPRPVWQALSTTQGKPQNGFLRANDIYNLKLPARDFLTGNERDERYDQSAIQVTQAVVISNCQLG